MNGRVQLLSEEQADMQTRKQSLHHLGLNLDRWP
jgi:hypothetical protein